MVKIDNFIRKENIFYSMGTKKDIFDKVLHYSMGKEDKLKYDKEDKSKLDLPKSGNSPNEVPYYKTKKKYVEKVKHELEEKKRRYYSDHSEKTFARKYPKITSTRNIHEALELRVQEDLTTFYIDGVSVVSYSPTPREHFGRKFNLDKEDLAGKLFFNTGFFNRFDLHRPMKTESDMENISKTFFKVNGDNYVALVQYLREGGRSAEHYHTLEESIAQLAGKSYVELRPIEDDTNYRIVELGPGDILRIPPNNLHFVGTIEGGSLTIPIKKTLKFRNDHLSIAKSDSRISQEVDGLLHAPGYSSGNAIISTLQDYYETLKSGNEKISAMKIINDLSQKNDNPNIRRILKKFTSEFV